MHGRPGKSHLGLHSLKVIEAAPSHQALLSALPAWPVGHLSLDWFISGVSRQLQGVQEEVDR